VQECGFSDDKVISIPTGINFSGFTPCRSRAQVRAELGLPQDAFVILMAGIIRSVKRHEVALRAMAQLSTRIGSSYLILAGDGPLTESMKQLAEEVGIVDKVIFLGYRNDIADLMGAADCLLLTSRSEGAPQAVTQALGAGLPVVATAVGGVPELVHDRRTGLLVPAEDVTGITNALEYIFQHPEEAKELARQGREHARSHYSLEAMLERTELEYQTLLEERTQS